MLRPSLFLSRHIVGQSLIFDNEPYCAIGVLPREFHFAMRTAEFFATIDDLNRCEQSRGCGTQNDMLAILRLIDPWWHRQKLF